MEEVPERKTALEIEHAIGNTCKLNNAVFVHPNGKDVVYPGGGCVIVRDMTDPHKQEFLRGHDDDVSCVDLSPTGRYIASGQIGDNADVCVWDFDSRKLIFRLNEHDYGVSLCEFSRDEKLLLTVGDVRDNRIIIWDLSNGYVVVSTYLDKQMRRTYHDQTATRRTCVGVWGGKTRDVKKRETRQYQFVLAKDDSLLHFVLDPFKGRIERFSMDCKARVRNYTCLKFNTFGDRLFAGTESGDIILFNVVTRQYIAQLHVCSRKVSTIHLLGEDCGRIVVGGGDGSVTEYERVLSGRSYYQHQEKIIPQKKIEFKGSEVHSVSPFHPISSPKKFVVGNSTGEMYHLDYDEFKAECFTESHGDNVLDVCFGDGVSDKFATCSTDQTIRYWDSSSYKVCSEARFRHRQHSQAKIPTSMTFVKDILFSGWSDGSVRTVDSLTGDILWERKEAHRGSISCMVSGKNCKFFLTGGNEGNVKVWSVKGMNLVSNFKDHRSNVTDLCLFNDDVHFLSSSKDKYILCWDLRKEKCVGTYYSKTFHVKGISLRSNQTQFVSVGGKQVSVWDIRQPKPTHILKFSDAKVKSAPPRPPEENASSLMRSERLSAVSDEVEGTTVDFSPSGKYFAVGGSDEVIKLFDFNSKRVVSRGRGHSGCINKLRFSPDEKQVVSVGSDGMIFLWNLFEF